MSRVSVPVPEELRQQVDHCPDDLGLDPSASEAQRFAALVTAGAQAMRARVRDERRELAYAEHNASEGYQEAVKMGEEWAFDDEGGF